MRPEGMKNPYEAKPGNAADLDRIGREIAFEAGADAYEEGLKKEGRGLEKGLECSHIILELGLLMGNYMRIDEPLRKSGYLVFIPEEKG